MRSHESDKAGQVVYGTNRIQLLRPRCAVCGKVVAVRVDPEDWERHRSGVLVQDAFADEQGKPYLDPETRELFISATCGDCWPCSSNHLDYN